MKFPITISSTIASLALGFLAGRQTAPTPSEETIPESSRSKRTTSRANQATPPTGAINETIKTASDLQGLLALVDPLDQFGTSIKLRASLANASADRLEDLTTQLLDLNLTTNGYLSLIHI